ncbi:MAG: hypothetical protein NZ483_07365 [Verrucomicrobiae bacterium]|nr:hypothetical protein [Verrucomicrobiae bacterium]
MTKSEKTSALPSLATLAAEIKRLPSSANYSQYLYERLRVALEQVQGPQPQPFYSVRTLATACRLHPSTVTDLYARLEADGLLVRVRGAGTVVAPQRHRGTHAHQVIAVPLWIPGFIHIPDWRLFFLVLQDEFSRHGAVADFIFYRQGEEVEPAFIRRIKAHRPDLVFWHEPHPQSDKQALLRLSDAGLRVLATRDKPLLPSFPGYWIDRQPALRRGLEEWRAAGIRRVILPMAPETRPDQQVMEALRMFPFSVTPMVWRGDNPENFLRTLEVEHGGVIWMDALFYSGLQQSAPKAMTELCRRTRVWLARSRQLPPSTPPDVRVDVLEFDYRATARRVARDIASGAVWSASTPGLIEYKWRGRVSSADVVTARDLV